MLKKILISMLLCFTMLFVVTGCSNDAATTPKDPAVNQESGKASGTDETGKAPGAKPTYKETMVPFDQLIPAERIVLLQNTLNYTRDGFYTADTKPVTKDIEYKGTTVAAYSMSYPLDFLKNDIKGDLKVTKTDGSTTNITAADFTGLYVIIDFTSDKPPVLYNPQSGTEITDFLFATTAEGEAIYSIVSGSTHKTDKIIADVGFDSQGSYRYVASDKFHIPASPAENAVGEIRGTLSGSINGSFPGMVAASGKINDVIYIEAIK